MILNRQRDEFARPPRVRIGLFDSGAGGLSVLRRLVLAGGDSSSYVYLADTARCPYGNRPASEIAAFAEQTGRWLVDSAVDRIVMACNTSASIAGNTLRNKLTLPVHDLIRPVSIHCAARYKTVAVFATSATCRSGAFSKIMGAINPTVRVIEIPCPELVPLVEAGHLSGNLALEAVQRCIDRLHGEPIEALILGCTHFPFLSEAFATLIPAGVALIDPAEYVQLELLGGISDTYERHELLHLYRRCSFFTTGDADNFARTAERCLGLESGDLSANVCGISTSDFGSPIIHSAHVVGVEGLSSIANTISPLANLGPGAEVSI